jgi:polysaccharide export outer membrane protein
MRFLLRFPILAGGLAGFLAACSVLPSSGPLTAEVIGQEAPPGQLGGYVVIDIDERVASICAAQPRDSLKRIFDNRPPAPDLRIGVGDSVAVTIWEAAAGGLFSAAAGDRTISAGARTATIPDQVVPRDGQITIPYAGRLRVVGLRPDEVEREIVRLLQGKAIEPQAVVTISRNNSNTAVVAGEVTAGAIVPLSVKGDRLLDVIASAGGLKAPAHDSFVRLTRGRTTVTVAFNEILANPAENIYVRPSDVITVVRDPQTFTAFGGTGRNAAVPFDATGITLEEAVARAGGLNDLRADPGGVFLLRFEPTSLVSQLVPGRPLPSEGTLVPVVYRLDMRQANSFFLARAFKVHNKDILYIAAAPTDPVEKFLRLVGQVTSPVILLGRATN